VGADDDGVFRSVVEIAGNVLAVNIGCIGDFAAVRVLLFKPELVEVSAFIAFGLQAAFLKMFGDILCSGFFFRRAGAAALTQVGGVKRMLMFFLKKFCFLEVMTKSRMFRQAKQIFRQSGQQKYKESLFSASSLLNCDRHIEKRLLNWRAQKCTAWFRTEVHRSFTQKALILCFLCE
jgi:hypothetical protein